MISNEVVKTEDKETAPALHYIPKVDVWEDDAALHLTALMPGVKGEDVQVTLENSKLRIYGRSSAETPKDMKLIYSEYEDGDYERVFSLSEQIDQHNIVAEVSNGILRVDFPKAPEARPVQIPVKAS